MLTCARVIVGVGIDVIEISRLSRALARRGERLRLRLFTARERADCDRRARPIAQYALRFAAKEAGMKAVGTGWGSGVRWVDFEIAEGERGLELRLAGRAREIAASRGAARAWLAAGLTRTHAIAQVVLEAGEAE